MNRVNEIRSGFETAYIDGNVASSITYTDKDRGVPGFQDNCFYCCVQMDGTLHLRMWVPFFVVCSGTTHQIISEVMLMAVRKEYRDLTVGDIYRNGKSVPMLRVSGLWLEELGFKTGDFVRIKCEDGQLIISLNEEKTQEKAAEKAFMDEEMKKLRKRYQREKEEICARYVAEEKAGYGA